MVSQKVLQHGRWEDRGCAGQWRRSDRSMQSAHSVAGFAGIALEHLLSAQSERTQRNSRRMRRRSSLVRASSRGRWWRPRSAASRIRLYTGRPCGPRLQAGQVCHQLPHLHVVHNHRGHSPIAHLAGGVVQQCGQLVAGELRRDTDERWREAGSCPACPMAGGAALRNEDRLATARLRRHGSIRGFTWSCGRRRGGGNRSVPLGDRLRRGNHVRGDSLRSRLLSGRRAKRPEIHNQ